MKRLDQEPLADWTRRVLEDERAQWDPLTLRDALRAWLAEYGQQRPIPSVTAASSSRSMRRTASSRAPSSGSVTSRASCGGCGGHGFDRDSDGWVQGICKGCGGTGELRP